MLLLASYVNRQTERRNGSLMMKRPIGNDDEWLQSLSSPNEERGWTPVTSFDDPSELLHHWHNSFDSNSPLFFDSR